MIQFHYAVFFWLLAPFGLITALYAWSRIRRKKEILALGDWRLIQSLIPLNALNRRRQKDLMALLGLLFVLVAATGPQFGSRLKEVKHRGMDVFIAMDTSRSMMAEDVPPSRLERAKRSLSLLIRKMEGNRVGIIAFTRDAVVQCPLTIDNDAARMFLDILDENTIPYQGTSIGGAIRLALKSFPENDRAGKAIVLLTDGEDHNSDPVEAAQEAKKKGVVIFTIGIGTTKGDVIKDKDEQGNITAFHKYQGSVVLSRLDDGLLTKVAMITGGRYYRASSTDSEIDEIGDILNGFDKKELSSRLFERLQERYQIFVAIALLFLLLEFFYAEAPGQGRRLLNGLHNLRPTLRWRRKTAMTLLLVVFAFSGSGWADIKTHVRKGNQLIKKKDFAGARQEFEAAQIDEPEETFLSYNIGTSYYLEGKLEDAKREYETALSQAKDPGLRAKAAYNLGHVLFNMNQPDAAIDKFKECLKIDPSDMDAKYNIEYIRSGKKPQNPNKNQQQQQQQQNQENQKNDQKNQKPDSGQKQNQASQKQQNQDQDKEKASRENADQVLRMMQDQEAEKMRKTRPLTIGEKDKKEKKEENQEDW